MVTVLHVSAYQWDELIEEYTLISEKESAINFELFVAGLDEFYRIKPERTLFFNGYCMQAGLMPPDQIKKLSNELRAC